METLLLQGLTELIRARSARRSWLVVPLIVAAFAVVAASAAHASEAWAQAGKKMLQDDFPFQTACIGVRCPLTNNNALKGVAIRVGPDTCMLFDTDLLRMTAGWTGGFITTEGVAYNGAFGPHPLTGAEEKFITPPLPGWTSGTNDFHDPRPEPYGALPHTWCRWKGLYVAGNRVVLSYTIGGVPVIEEPSSVTTNGQTGFIRTFELGPVPQPLSMMVCQAEGATDELTSATAILRGTNGTVTAAALVGAPATARLTVTNSRIVMRLSPGTAATTNAPFKLVIWSGPATNLASFPSLLGGRPQIAEFRHGGPAHWPAPIVTNGVVAASSTPDGAYVLDQITAPMANPWQRRVRLGGLDFFSDGKRAALCTWEGDIWIVSGIDETLQHVTWRRFASGMYETLGLKIVNDVIYTTGRDQVTRYHDLNGDGEADYYESVNNDVTSTQFNHEYVFDLQTDTNGDFYFSKAGPWKSGGRGLEHVSAHAGTLLKLSKDGEKLEVIATGLRTPNGISVGPHGELTVGDNEGTWIPATPINWVKRGDFLGCVNTAHVSPVPEFHQPMCWLSHNGPEQFDNSAGGQVWVTSTNWGPFAGALLHMSYGKCRLFLVMHEEIKGVQQAGVVRIPVKFTSSAVRARFNPRDGQLYVCGLGGWQCDSAVEGGFDRLRYTGKPVHSVCSLHVTHTGVQLGFTQPLDAASATDVQNYSVKRWNYERAEHYGSPEFSVANPGRQGKDNVDVKSAKLGADGKTVELELVDLKPVMQQRILFRIKARDGTPLEQEIQETINVIP